MAGTMPALRPGFTFLFDPVNSNAGRLSPAVYSEWIG